MVIATRGNKRRLVTHACHQLKPKHTNIEAQRTIEISDLQVHMANVHAGIESLRSLRLHASTVSSETHETQTPDRIRLSQHYSSRVLPRMIMYMTPIRNRSEGYRGEKDSSCVRQLWCRGSMKARVLCSASRSTTRAVVQSRLICAISVPVKRSVTRSPAGPQAEGTRGLDPERKRRPRRTGFSSWPPIVLAALLGRCASCFSLGCMIASVSAAW